MNHAIDFAVVAPDDPLALGCVDRLHEAGIPCIGPDAKAAHIKAIGYDLRLFDSAREYFNI